MQGTRLVRTFTITDTKILWVDSKSQKTRSYGFVNEQLVFVIRVSDAAELRVQRFDGPQQFSVYDLIEDVTIEYTNSIDQARQIAADQLLSIHGRNVTRRYFRAPPPVRDLIHW